METLSSQIEQGYEQYFLALQQQEAFFKNLFEIGLTEDAFYDKLLRYQEFETKQYEQNNLWIKNFLAPYLYHKKSLNDSIALTLLECIEAHLKAGDYDALLILETANLLVNYYKKESHFAEKIRARYAILKYYDHNIFVYNHEEIQKQIQCAIEESSVLLTLHDATTAIILIDNLYLSFKNLTHYADMDIAEIEKTYHLAKTYLQSDNITQQLNPNYIKNRILDLDEIIMDLPTKYTVSLMNHQKFAQEIHKLLEKRNLNFSPKPFIEEYIKINDILGNYIVGQCTLEELKNTLNYVLDLPFSKGKDVKAAGRIFIVQLSQFSHFIYDEETKKAIYDKIKSFLKWAYYQDSSRINHNHILQYVSSFIKELPEELQRQMLISWMDFHPFHATLHSLFVGEISKEITQALLDGNSSYFVGYKNYTPEQVRLNKKSILDDAFLAGYLHDIGKDQTMMKHQLLLRSKTTLEESYHQYHPLCDKLLFNNNSWIQDVVCHHHLFHNKKGGYPKGKHFNPETVALVEIVSIANEIDLSTNFFYFHQDHAPSVKVLLKKLNENSKKRFNKAIMMSLNFSPLFHSRLEYLLGNGKKQIIDNLYRMIIKKELQ